MREEHRTDIAGTLAGIDTKKLAFMFGQEYKGIRFAASKLVNIKFEENRIVGHFSTIYHGDDMVDGMPEAAGRYVVGSVFVEYKYLDENCQHDYKFSCDFAGDTDGIVDEIPNDYK